MYALHFIFHVTRNKLQDLASRERRKKIRRINIVIVLVLKLSILSRQKKTI